MPIQTYSKGAGTSGARIIKRYACEASAQAGNVVYISATEDGKVLVNIDNKEFRPSIGIIISKLSDTRCRVLQFGPCSFTFSGLIRGKKVFLSETGSLTTTVPIDGYLQGIGFCYEQDKVFVDVELEKVKQTPF